MCGIAGILTNSELPVEHLSRRMQNSLQHRGPDDQGIYISSNRKAALAHTRLSILDLTPAGHQPMPTSNDRYWITFNGEIYNFQQLRSQLQSQGEKFHSQTDTEVILKLYQKKGQDCVKYLRGMFAFAIWDDQEKTCFIARDPLGIKPLYYWQSGSLLLFASELRSILASGLLTPTLSPQGLYGYLTIGSVPEPHTLIEGVKCLKAGHWLHWSAGNTNLSQYWEINFTPTEISRPEAINKVRSALIDTIKYHFLSDVPVGVFLSGGIDSSAIVALARQTQTGKLRTYSIEFEEQAWNEGKISQKVAQQFQTEHTKFIVTPSFAKSLLPKFLSVLDQPSIDGFNTFCVSQLARNHGTKVALSGLGGDELFGGYPSFQEVPQMLWWRKKMGSLKPLSAGIGTALERWATSHQLKRLGDFLQQPPTTIAAYRSFRGIFSNGEATQIAAQFLPDRRLCRELDNTDETSDFPSIADEVSLLEISQYMRNQLLRDSDVMSMAWGLELRVPFVDQLFVQTIASIPSSIRLSRGKQLLIEAVPELPTWVVNRPKQGFFFPFQDWLEGEWSNYLPQVDCPKNISLHAWYRRWSLAILQNWWEKISK